MQNKKQTATDNSTTLTEKSNFKKQNNNLVE